MLKQLLVALATLVGALAGIRGGPSGQSAVRLSSNSIRQAAFDPGSFTLKLQQVANGLNSPVYVTGAGDGSGRLFVVEQGGTIRIVQNGALLSQPFLDIRPLVLAGGERGLLSVAFHPKYAANGRFFVYYTAKDASVTLAEYHVSASDPNQADPASGTVLFSYPHADFPNHNGGLLLFGPDGYLYMGTGDGGGGGDPNRNGQNLGSVKGKLLRFDIDHGSPYGIPPDNPFANQAGARPEIWAYGLRNPWRYSFDPATGDLWIADVGQDAWEEIDVQPAGTPGGQNYGWNVMEGMHCYPPNSSCTPTGTPPIAEYGHDLGCAIVGGYVYRGAGVPALQGVYLFADECSGRIWALYPGQNGWQRAELMQAKFHISSFGRDDTGEVYVVSLEGAVYQVGGR
jgi:glucose/arabinose dehydrogenase